MLEAVRGPAARQHTARSDPFPPMDPVQPFVATSITPLQGPQLAGAEKEAFEYHISLVRMLATCCEGDNRFIESMCQNIFRAKDLFPVCPEHRA